MLALSDIAQLHKKKFRDEFNLLLIEGEHLVLELEKTNFIDCEIIYTEKFNNYKSRFIKNLVTDKQFNKFSDTENPQGIAALIPLNNFTKINKGKKIIYLDKVQDPGNLGNIIRSAAWFGGFTIQLSQNSVDPYNSKVVRSSMGGIFHVNIEQDCFLPSQAKKLAFAMDGLNIHNVNLEMYDIYVFGNEASGLDKSILKECDSVSIPGTVLLDSLNLATCVSICMFKLNEQINEPK